MKKQTFILKHAKGIFGLEYRKMHPRDLVMFDSPYLTLKDKKKLENISADLHKKYGECEFYIKVKGDKVTLIPFDEDDSFGGVF